VIEGNGTIENPYIIGWWMIDAGGQNYAIYIGNTTAHFIITHCFLHNASNAGIILHNVSNAHLTNNKIYNNKYGVIFSKTHHSVLASNEFYNNTISIHIISSNNPLYYNHTVYSNNTVDNKPIYYLFNRRNITLKNLNVGYIGIYYSQNISLENITLERGSGVYSQYTNHFKILNSFIKNSHFGLYINQSTNIEVMRCYFIDNLFGILIDNTSEGDIVNNTLLKNTYGITLTNSTQFLIYHNNFVNNLKYQASDNWNNKWYLSSVVGGNYWSDYNGRDNNGDGFGDQPYNISAGPSQDLYPLLEPWDFTSPEVRIISPTNNDTLNNSTIILYWDAV
jgi:parallel beta-helix repeat protein